MKKFITFEETLDQKMIERILWEYFCDKLDKEDVDFKKSRLMQPDYTYSFQDGKPQIDVVIMIEDANLRPK